MITELKVVVFRGREQLSHQRAIPSLVVFSVPQGVGGYITVFYSEGRFFVCCFGHFVCLLVSFCSWFIFCVCFLLFYSFVISRIAIIFIKFHSFSFSSVCLIVFRIFCMLKCYSFLLCYSWLSITKHCRVYLPSFILYLF